MIQSEFIYPADYETFWRLFGAGDRYANRKYAAYRQRWLARTETDRQAMIDYLEAHGAPRDRNPYFWIEDFTGIAPQPTVAQPPTNYFGRQLPRSGTFYKADYHGVRGLYTEEDVRAHHMANPELFMQL